LRTRSTRASTTTSATTSKWDLVRSSGYGQAASQSSGKRRERRKLQHRPGPKPDAAQAQAERAFFDGYSAADAPTPANLRTGELSSSPNATRGAPTAPETEVDQAQAQVQAQAQEQRAEEEQQGEREEVVQEEKHIGIISSDDNKHKREQSESNYECVINQLKELHGTVQEQPVVGQHDDPLALLEVTMNAGAADSDVNVLKLACDSLLHRLSSSEADARVGATTNP
jgi:hypothetical protein